MAEAVRERTISKSRYIGLAESGTVEGPGEAAPDRRRGITLADALDEFVTDYRRQNRRESTIRVVEDHLTRRHPHTRREGNATWFSLLPYCEQIGMTYLADLDRAVVLQWMDHLREKAALNNWDRAAILVNRFFGWASEEAGYLQGIPCRVKRPRKPAADFDIFTDEEVESMHRAVKRENTRDYAIFLLMLETGLRRHELLSLTLDDVRLDRKEIVVRGAGAKTWEGRTIPIYDSVRALRAWLRDRTETRKTPYFFLSFRKTPVWSGGREKTAERRPTRASIFDCLSANALRPDALEKLVKKWGKLGGVTVGRCSPHTFRHYMAVRWLRDHPGDIRRLQYVLGHKKLETTAKYLRFTDHEGIKEAFENHSPIRHLMNSRERGLAE